MAPLAPALPRLNRAQLLVAAAAGLLASAAPAAASTFPDADLAYVRLLVAVELLKADFEGGALHAGHTGKRLSHLLHRMHAADQAHYTALAAVLDGAGQPPATAADIDFSYPRGSFASQRAAARLAARLTTLGLGAYLGAIENVQTAELRLPLAQIAASEAQQLSAVAALLGDEPVARAFPASLPMDAVSAALDRYEG